MNRDELRAAISASTAEQWDLLDGWPTYLNSFGEVRGDGQTWLEHKAHHARAVFAEDLSIGLAWGLEQNPDFREEWIERALFHGRASGHWIDVLYHGQPVDRLLYVHVDGRCKLPVPQHHPHGDVLTPRPNILGITVSSWERDVVALAHCLESGTREQFDQYMDRASILVGP